MKNIKAVSLPKFTLSTAITKYFSLAMPVGAMVVSVVILAIVVRPKFTQVLRLQNENKELATRVSNLENKVAVVSSMDVDLLNNQLISAAQIIPSDKDVFNIVRQVEAAALSSGVLLSKLDVVPGKLDSSSGTAPTAPVAPTPGSSAPNIGADSKIQLKISLNSDYRSFLQFTSSLLTLPRVVTIKDLSLAGEGNNSGSQITTSMTVEAYWKPFPKELGSIETPIEQLTDGDLELIKRASSGPPAGSNILPVETGRSDLFAPF